MLETTLQDVRYALRVLRQSPLFTLTAALPGVALTVEYNLDANGTLRGFDGVWDRGAYEFGGTSQTAPSAPTNLRIIP